MNKSPLTEQQAAHWASYQRMRTQLAGHLNRDLTQQTGLSEADYEILEVLLDTPRKGMRSLELRCTLAWEKSRLSHQLRRMEKRGLIERRECTEDNRGIVIHLTQEGCKMAREAKQYYEESVQRYVMDVLSVEQLESLGKIAEVILDSLHTHQCET